MEVVIPFIIAKYNYWIYITLMMIGFYTLITKGNLIKKLVGLNIFQVSVIMFYVAMGKVRGGTAPIEAEGFTVFSNPLPHVLMLTAIVVGVATTALALSLVVRINEAYETIEEDELRELERGHWVACHLADRAEAQLVDGVPQIVFASGRGIGVHLLKRLGDILKSVAPQNAPRGAAHEAVVRAMDAAGQMGFTRLSIASVAPAGDA